MRVLLILFQIAQEKSFDYLLIVNMQFNFHFQHRWGFVDVLSASQQAKNFAGLLLRELLGE